MTTTILPKVPSDLIELALADLIKCERSPKYVITMHTWYVPGFKACAVCLAGSIMAQTLGDGDKCLEPSDFQENEDQLNAVDNFRTGCISEGFENLEIDVAGRLFAPTDDYDITPYEDSPRKFKREMRKLARDLRAAGY